MTEEKHTVTRIYSEDLGAIKKLAEADKRSVPNEISFLIANEIERRRIALSNEMREMVKAD